MCVREYDDDNETIAIEMCDLYKTTFEKMADISEIINDVVEDIERKTYAIHHYMTDEAWMPSIEAGFDDVVELNVKLTDAMAEFLKTKQELTSIKAVCRD